MVKLCGVKLNEVEPWYSYVVSSRVKYRNRRLM